MAGAPLRRGIARHPLFDGDAACVVLERERRRGVAGMPIYDRKPPPDPPTPLRPTPALSNSGCLATRGSISTPLSGAPSLFNSKSSSLLLTEEVSVPSEHSGQLAKRPEWRCSRSSR
jgi:hypothetical protein